MLIRIGPRFTVGFQLRRQSEKGIDDKGSYQICTCWESYFLPLGMMTHGAPVCAYRVAGRKIFNPFSTRRLQPPKKKTCSISVPHWVHGEYTSRSNRIRRHTNLRVITQRRNLAYLHSTGNNSNLRPLGYESIRTQRCNPLQLL